MQWNAMRSHSRSLRTRRRSNWVGGLGSKPSSARNAAPIVDDATSDAADAHRNKQHKSRGVLCSNGGMRSAEAYSDSLD